MAKGDQWNKYRSQMGPVPLEAVDPIFDAARDAAQKYYEDEGYNYACNPRAKLRNHIESGFSNFEFREIKEDEDVSWMDADNAAGFRPDKD